MGVNLIRSKERSWKKGDFFEGRAFSNLSSTEGWVYWVLLSGKRGGEEDGNWKSGWRRLLWMEETDWLLSVLWRTEETVTKEMGPRDWRRPSCFSGRRCHKTKRKKRHLSYLFLSINNSCVVS